MKNQTKYFIFETFRNKLYPVSEAVSNGLIVLKEIEVPDRVKIWLSFAATNATVFYILSGIFVFKAKYTSIVKRWLVQVGLLTYKQWLCYKLLTTTETNTANDTTAENGLLLYSLNGGKGVASLPHSFRLHSLGLSLK